MAVIKMTADDLVDRPRVPLGDLDHPALLREF